MKLILTSKYLQKSVNDLVEESDDRRAPSDETTRKSEQRENDLIAIGAHWNKYINFECLIF